MYIYLCACSYIIMILLQCSVHAQTSTYNRCSVLALAFQVSLFDIMVHRLHVATYSVYSIKLLILLYSTSKSSSTHSCSPILVSLINQSQRPAHQFPALNLLPHPLLLTVVILVTPVRDQQAESEGCLLTLMSIQNVGEIVTTAPDSPERSHKIRV